MNSEFDYPPVISQCVRNCHIDCRLFHFTHGVTGDLHSFLFTVQVQLGVKCQYDVMINIINEIKTRNSTGYI